MNSSCSGIQKKDDNSFLGCIDTTCEQAASMLVTVSAYSIAFGYRRHKGRHFIGCMRVSMQRLYWVRTDPLNLQQV